MENVQGVYKYKGSIKVVVVVSLMYKLRPLEHFKKTYLGIFLPTFHVNLIFFKYKGSIKVVVVVSLMYKLRPLEHFKKTYLGIFLPTFHVNLIFFKYKGSIKVVVVVSLMYKLRPLEHFKKNTWAFSCITNSDFLYRTFTLLPPMQWFGIITCANPDLCPLPTGLTARCPFIPVAPVTIHCT